MSLIIGHMLMSEIVVREFPRTNIFLPIYNKLENSYKINYSEFSWGLLTPKLYHSKFATYIF